MKAIILAAGKGKRLHSEEFQLPKVLRKACGRPLLRYVLESLSFLNKEEITIVVGYLKDEVIREAGEGYCYCEQREQLGTGHAVNAASDLFRDYSGPVLVCYGDMPLFKQETYRRIFRLHEQERNDCTMLTGITSLPLAYGRVIRDESGNFLRVVEEKDCTPEQKKIRELNVGVYVFDSKLLFQNLQKLKNHNAQGEYYLTDVPELLLAEGYKVGICPTTDGTEILGVNTQEDLKTVEQYLSSRK